MCLKLPFFFDSYIVKRTLHGVWNMIYGIFLYWKHLCEKTNKQNYTNPISVKARNLNVMLRKLIHPKVAV